MPRNNQYTTPSSSIWVIVTFLFHNAHSSSCSASHQILNGHSSACDLRERVRSRLFGTTDTAVSPFHGGKYDIWDVGKPLSFILQSGIGDISKLCHHVCLVYRVPAWGKLPHRLWRSVSPVKSQYLHNSYLYRRRLDPGGALAVPPLRKEEVLRLDPFCRQCCSADNLLRTLGWVGVDNRDALHDELENTRHIFTTSWCRAQWM